jgi:hypothetical protein
MERNEQFEDGYQNEFGGIESESPDIDLDRALGEATEVIDISRNLDESEEGNFEPEEVSKSPKKDPLKTKLNQVQREKYQAIDEASKLREELERYKAMADLSTQAATRHYEDSVLQKLDRAKQLKAQAYESGDVQAQIDADVELSMATNEIQNLNTWKTQQEISQNQYQDTAYQQSSYNAPQPDVNEVRRWADQNTWFDPSTEDYDPRLAEEVHLYSTQLENSLYRAGQGHMIYSREYFDVIDNHVNHLRPKLYGNSNTRRELSMRPSRSAVSPVTRGYAQSEGEGRQQFKLDPEQREMARRLGVDERAYAQHYIKDMKEGRNRRGGR